MRSFSSAVCLLLAPAVARGAALLQPRNLLQANALDPFKPIAVLAAAGYCRANDTAVWDCGDNCSGVKDFIPTASGGDGVFVQYWFVGFYPPLKSVVVSHQGTRRQNVIPLLTDLNFFFEEPDAKTFPGLAAAGIRMHNGFHDQHAFTYPEVRAAVEKTMSAYKTKAVTFTGHSLGAALSVLDAIALKFVLPKDTQFNIVNFGQPRMGNPALADYVDKQFPSRVLRFTNKNDQVPTLPGRFLGFKHFKGEVHIRSKDAGLFVCSGQDNEAADCSIGEVPNVFSGDSSQHKGPYLGQIMKCFDKNGVQVRDVDDTDGDYY